MPRSDVLTIAYGLIEVAEAMLPQTAFATSDLLAGHGFEKRPSNMRFCEPVRRAGRGAQSPLRC